MIARLVMAMGGRAAEELVFAEPTTGASSDIAQATVAAIAAIGTSVSVEMKTPIASAAAIARKTASLLPRSLDDRSSSDARIAKARASKPSWWRAPWRSA